MNESNRAAVDLKVKYYEEFIVKLDGKNTLDREMDKTLLSNLQVKLEKRELNEATIKEQVVAVVGNDWSRENEALIKQVEDMRFECDELKDENEQLVAEANEMRQMG